MVTRLVAHKGLDIVKDALESILNEKVQFVVLGTGDSYYEGFFKDMEYKYGNKLKTIVAFNQDLSRKIYAASDIFLMPSKSEPCGLAQMIACSYGTVPIVRAVGGLYDTIKSEVNGFVFKNFNAHELLYRIKDAVSLYRSGEAWSALRAGAMESDFTWSSSAIQYRELYSRL
jgi:starch synthase